MAEPEDDEQPIHLTNDNVPTDIAQDVVDVLGYLVAEAGGLLVVPNSDKIAERLKNRTLCIRYDASRDDQCILTLVEAD
jgi:hypothetical protein